MSLIAVAMSGGVDSSVAAALLTEAGEQVFGLMLRLWSAGERYPNRCCSPTDLANARTVAAQLEIPFYALDAQQPFKRLVVDPFVDGYESGLTPNPCFACNREIRWGLLLEKALQLGATHLATGHYAQRQRREDGGYRLLRAVDRAKDQSYVLSVLGQTELRSSLFPLGGLLKRDVRSKAVSLDLPVANREESQDLCFLGGADYRDFLSEHGNNGVKPGVIHNQHGKPIGAHDGLHRFTIGQRKGIGISASQPLYVIEKNAETQALVVGPRDSLLRRSFRVSAIHWVSGIAPDPSMPLTVQVRYKARAVDCTLTEDRPPGSAVVQLGDPLAAITPGQAAVFYRGDECLGGGLISS